ncbi:MAG: dienelactone hydrolase family protein [Deltaproteobacteria bacterium]
MCDDATELENEAYLERVRLNRREVGIGAGVVVAAALTGCKAGGAPAPEPKTKSRAVTITTPDGEAEAFFVAPAEGRHPAVLVWPDVAGLRDAYRTMATRLATSGYAVLAVNPYYRSSKLPVMETFAEWRTEEGRAKIKPMREALTHEAITRDGAAFVAWLDQQPEVDTDKKIGTTGYCMGGPFTFRTAAAAPERVGAIGSFHGGGLVTDEPTSPHRLLAQMKAAALICVAQNDDERQPEAKTVLAETAKAVGRPAEVEVYPAQHGWCTIDSPVYDEAQAERAWARLLATLRAHL